MLSKRYLSSLDFVILLVTAVSSALFIMWALVGPFNYEKAAYEEQLGHQLAKKGKAKEASKHFLIAAKITDDNVSTSRRYRCAGSTSASDKDKIKYFRLALKFNPNNQNAIRGLKPLFSEFIYTNRSVDGWSQGKSVSIVIKVLDISSEYVLSYFTSSPKKMEYKIKILADDELYKQQKIISGKKYSVKITLPTGRHHIDISINDTFNPKKLGMSRDNRDLGVHFEIKRVEPESG